MLKKAERFKRRLKLCEVSPYILSSAMITAAEERTEEMVSLFVMEARDGQRWMEDLHMLVRSAYLQGACDTAEVAARMLERPPGDAK